MTQTEEIDLETVQVIEKEKAEKEKEPRSYSRWIILFIAVLLVAAAVAWWLHSEHYESTDDAQIEGHLDAVSPRISGSVTYINPQVENNEIVEAGTLLL